MQKYNKTEIKIIDAARDLFLENGYHETSMSSIADKADLGKGTLYWHFDSKGELFQSMISREGKLMYDELKELSKKNMSSDQIIKEFIKLRLKRTLEEKRPNKLFLDSQNFINEEFKKTMMRIIDSVVELLTDIIKDGIDNNIFYTTNPEKAASALLWIIYGLCTNITLKENGDIDLKEETEFVYNLFLNGLKNKEGEKY
ncbi:MAG: TetR/AcrR family transcriptional regulator [Bacillota bacterium]